MRKIIQYYSLVITLFLFSSVPSYTERASRRSHRKRVSGNTQKLKKKKTSSTGYIIIGGVVVGVGLLGMGYQFKGSIIKPTSISMNSSSNSPLINIQQNNNNNSNIQNNKQKNQPINIQITPFLSAASKGQLSRAKKLKDIGANINATNDWGDNALHYACWHSGSTEMVTWLLDVCLIGIETEGYAKNTPFLCAASKGQLAIAQLLKERNADINKINGYGDNALHLACSASGNEATINWLLGACGIRIETRGHNSETPFLCALKARRLEIAKLLKERGADINVKTEHGDNALHYACWHSGSTEMIGWLLSECKIGLETKGWEQRTPFLWAVAKGRLEIAKLLKERGANIDAKDQYGRNALTLAKMDNKNQAMISYLQSLKKESDVGVNS